LSSYPFLLAVVIMSGAALRLLSLLWGEPVYDELYTLWAARLPLDVLPQEVYASGHPPLYYLIGHYWFYPGAGYAWAGLVSWAAGVLSVPLAYLLGKELFSRRAGLCAALFVACSPLLILYSANVTDYSFFGAAALASFYFLARGIRRGGRRDWVGYTLFIAAAVFSHNLGLLLLAAEGVFFLLARRAGSPRLAVWLVSLVPVALLQAGWLLVNRGTPVATMGPHNPRLAELAEEAARAILLMLFSDTGIDDSGLWWKTAALLAVLAGLAAAGGVRRVLAGRAWLALSAAFLIVTVGTVVLALTLSEPGIDSVSERYLVVAAPLLALLLAALLAAAPPPLRFAGVAAVVAFSLILFEARTAERGDGFAPAMATVSREMQPGDKLLCFPVNHCYVAVAYYLEEAPPVSGGYIIVEEPGSVMFDGSTRGTWEGYRDVLSSERKLYAGAGLEDKLSAEAAGAKRLWLLEGSESGRGVIDSSMIYAALGKRWRVSGSWDFDASYALTLYVPKND